MIPVQYDTGTAVRYSSTVAVPDVGRRAGWRVEWYCVEPNGTRSGTVLSSTREKLADVPTWCWHPLLVMAALHEVEAIVRGGHPNPKIEDLLESFYQYGQQERPYLAYPHHSKILGEEGRCLEGDDLPVTFSQGARLGSNGQSGQHGFTPTLPCVVEFGCVLCFSFFRRAVTIVEICRRCPEGIFHDPFPEPEGCTRSWGRAARETGEQGRGTRWSRAVCARC